MRKFFVLVSALALTIGAAEASSIQKTIASFDITPCSRTTGYKDDFGIWWPTIQFARQSVDLNVVLSSSLNANELTRVFNDCNNIALATAGGVSIYAGNPNAFAGAYKAAFQACLGTQAVKEVINLNVAVDSTCHW